ncbi:MAG: hypothetical protein J7K73_03585 [Nanoarchaeota archaeon]|nr:hypothetical protein [Nanoarchaeota archaeon]
MKLINHYLVSNDMDYIISELAGAIVGDGHIVDNRKYSLYIYGNATEDFCYLRYLSSHFEKLFGISPRLGIRVYKNGRAAILQIHNKDVVRFFTKVVGIPAGNKIYSVSIPSFVDESNIKYFVRGLFDTDGCIVFTKSKTNSLFPTYPRIEIKTSSGKLSSQLIDVLNNIGFKVNLRRDGTSNIIYVSGNLQVDKWFGEIGSSNLKNLVKFQFWRCFGYHLPGLDVGSRLKILKRAGRVELPSTGDCQSLLKQLISPS